MGMIYAVTSGKGGAGKSTVASGLSIAFTSLGKRVLLVDLDEGLRCLDLMLGVDREVVFDLADVLEGREIDDAVYPVPGTQGLYLVPAPREVGRIESGAFSAFVREAAADYDAVMLDFPAGLDFRLCEALPDTVQYLTVCEPDPVSVRDASVVCGLLPPAQKPPLLIINRFYLKAVMDGFHLNIDDTIDASGFRLLGVVPQSRELKLLSVQHRLTPWGRSMKAFDRIVRRLSGEAVRLSKPRKI